MTAKAANPASRTEYHTSALSRSSKKNQVPKAPITMNALIAMKDDEAVMENKTAYNVTCYPLYTILKALEVERVDYLSVDVEGWELAILKTVPFDKIDIKVRCWSGLVLRKHF